MSDLIGLIPAAGRGVRAYPYTQEIPKSMLQVDGVPLLQRNVDLMRDELGIRDVRIAIGHQGHVIRDHFGDGSNFDLRITYVVNDRIDLELPYSIYVAGKTIDGPCCVILADECYVGTNHRELVDIADDEAPVTCALIETDNPKYIRKNYVVELREGAIVALQEKPTVVKGSLMGAGTYILRPEVLRRLEGEFEPDVNAGPKDWTTWIDKLCAGGERVVPFYLTGQYVNVNSRDDLNYANYLIRSGDFADRRKSLIYIIDEETEASARPILKFAAEPEIDEVAVVARRHFDELTPYTGHSKVRTIIADDPSIETGELVKLGLDGAGGSIFILSYSDDTFVPSDVSKLLVYLRDADMVVGTRTTRQMIEQGANMRGLIRASHVLLAKLVEILWWRFEPRFTDICCVYRAFWRSTYEDVRSNLTARGVEVFPELVLEALRARKRIIEVPVNYYNRDVESSYVRSKYQSTGTFLRILRLILRKRWNDTWWGD
jgi:NDP-sugar pyrophosphorylase family protein